jgi:uncharacterized protein (TIGR02300 family)
MVDPKLGTKRSCPACEAKFYDLNKLPAVCPKCGHSFDPSALVAAAAPRKIEPQTKPVEDEDEGELEDNEDELSLDAMAADEDDDDEDEDLPDFGESEDADTLLDDEDDDDDEDDGDFLEDEDINI